MNRNFLNIVPVVLASFAITSGAYAGHDECPNKYAPEHMMPMGTCGPCLASTEPNIDCYNFNFQFSVLYLQARVSGTVYGYTDNGVYNDLPIVGNLLAPSFDRDWGFKIGVGHTFDHDDWTSELVFTYFKSHGNHTADTVHNQLIIPCNVPFAGVLGSGNTGVDIEPANAARSDINLKYYVLDWDLHRGNYFCCSLSFEPRLGIKTAWIDIHQTSDFTGFQVSPVDEHSDLIHRNISDFWGIGPKFAFNTNWTLCEGFSIYGNFDAAILFGRVKLSARTLFEEPATVASIAEQTRDDITANHHMCSPTIHGVIGLQYDTDLKECCQHVMIRAGLDTTVWWNQNQVIKTLNAGPGVTGTARLPVCYDVAPNDLCLYGLVIDFRWDF